MANTYVLISSYNATGSVASIEFTSIPATYTDLMLVCSLRSDRNVGGVTSIFIKVNDLNTSIYNTIQLEGDGATASTDIATSVAPTSGANVGYGYASQATNTANTFGNTSFYFPNYAGSTNKSLSADSVSENNATTAYAALRAGLIATTNAITKIELIPTATFNWVQYSSASLYGISST
jgi:hypothetical protein